MYYQARQGQISAGEAIGILLLDTCVPFIPGDVANATTYRFPVRFQKVEGYTVARAIAKDPSVFDALKAAALALAEQGVRAVTGDCGFMAVHQAELAAALEIPVFLSSLLQLPFIGSIVGHKAKVGVITADSRSLDQTLLGAMGIREPERVVVAGLEQCPHFVNFAIEESGQLDAGAVQEEVVARAKNLMVRYPAVRAILLECSLLPPYAAAVQQAVGLPVFDYITMIHYVFSAVVREPFHGFL
jgi:Asp/Glu/hydantoin racemase